MSDTLFRKVGGRYKPVREYEAFDHLPAGFHMVHVKPGMRSLWYNVDPDSAPLLAALKANKDHLVKLVQDASEMTRVERHKSVVQKLQEERAWQAWKNIAPKNSLLQISGESAWSIVETLEKSLMGMVKK